MHHATLGFAVAALWGYQLIAGLDYALTDRCLLTGKSRYGRALEDFRDDGNAWSSLRGHASTVAPGGASVHSAFRCPTSASGPSRSASNASYDPVNAGCIGRFSAENDLPYTASGLSRRITTPAVMQRCLARRTPDHGAEIGYPSVSLICIFPGVIQLRC